MSWWERYRAWQLESRARYVATKLGVTLLIVLLAAWVFAGTHPDNAPLRVGIFIVLAILIHGWVYYPRAKARSQQASVSARRAHG